MAFVFWKDVRHGHEPVRIWIRERAQKNSIDDAENPSGGANSDSQRENCRQSATGSIAQSTGGVTKILGEGFNRIRHKIVSRSHLDDSLNEKVYTGTTGVETSTG